MKSEKIKMKSVGGDPISIQKKTNKYNTNIEEVKCYAILKIGTQNAITLISLIITIIILLILVGVTLNLMLGENGLFKITKEAGEQYEEQQAREKLEVVLLELQKDKIIDVNYKEDETINNKIQENGMIIVGDIVLVDGWQFEIDRSIPKISANLGKGILDKEIQIQVIKITVDKQYEHATIEIEINSEKDLESIMLKGKEIKVPEKQNGKYTISEQVEENGIYTIIAKDIEENFNIEKIQVTGIIKELYTLEDLMAFRDAVNEGVTFEGRTVSLMNDINLQGSETNQWIPIGDINNKFKGTFKGNNYNIIGMYMNKSDMRFLGFFCLNEGIIKNLNIVNCNINSTWNSESQSGWIGGIAGQNNASGKIQNCSVSGNISMSYNDNVAVKRKILGIGGIAGASSSVNKEIKYIEQCYNKANITLYSKNSSSTTNGIRIGGIVGYVTGSEIINCYNEGNISITFPSKEYIYAGGIAGTMDVASGIDTVDVENCYNIGTITKGENIGGIFSHIYSGTLNIKNCYYLNTCGGNNAKGEIALTEEQMKTATFANILNANEKYTSTMEWTSNYEDKVEYVWDYKGNYPTLK